MWGQAQGIECRRRVGRRGHDAHRDPGRRSNANGGGLAQDADRSTSVRSRTSPVLVYPGRAGNDRSFAAVLREGVAPVPGAEPHQRVDVQLRGRRPAAPACSSTAPASTDSVSRSDDLVGVRLAGPHGARRARCTWATERAVSSPRRSTARSSERTCTFQERVRDRARSRRSSWSGLLRKCSTFEGTAGLVDSDKDVARASLAVSADGVLLYSHTFSKGQSKNLRLDIAAGAASRSRPLAKNPADDWPLELVGLGNPRIRCTWHP